MLQNLLLINLFLIANALITLAFVLYGWVYLDLYLQRKKKNALCIGLGAWILALSFLSAIYFELREVGILKEYIFLSLQFIGLLSIAYGYSQEKIPVEPKLSTSKKKHKRGKTTKLKSVFLPFWVAFGFVANFFLAVFTTTKILHKINYGRSKEYRPLMYFWLIISFILLLNVVALFGNQRFPFIEISLMKFSFVWTVLQILLLVCFVLMYRWISLFLSFRNFTKVLFNLWSFSIILCVIIVSIFISINIPTYEKEVSKVLRSSGRMIEFNIENAQKANLSVLEVISTDDDIMQGIKEKDISLLDDKLRFMSLNNQNLDHLLITDAEGRIVYDLASGESFDELISGNEILMEALSNKEKSSGYWVENEGTIMERLGYQNVVPVFDDGVFVGLISATKYLDGSFLNRLTSYTQQDFLLVDDTWRILDSSLSQDLEFDDVIRINRVRALDEEGSVMVEINNNAYLGYYVDFEEKGGLLSLAPYDLVASTAENSMYRTSFYAVLISLLAIVPSYYFARKIEREWA